MLLAIQNIKASMTRVAMVLRPLSANEPFTVLSDDNVNPSIISSLRVMGIHIKDEIGVREPRIQSVSLLRMHLQEDGLYVSIKADCFHLRVEAI